MAPWSNGSNLIRGTSSSRFTSVEQRFVDAVPADWKLGQDERGLVLPQLLSPGEDVLQPQRPDPEVYRSAVLFWDKIDLPDNNLFSFERTPDENFLESAGVLKSTFIGFNGTFGGGESAREVVVKTFEALDEKFPGAWAVGGPMGQSAFGSRYTEAGRGLLFELTDAVPVPQRDVPLNEILEFKERRRAELLSLRWHLENVYQAISSAPDRPLAARTEMGRLDRAIADHVKVISEERFRLAIGQVQAKLSVADGFQALAAVGVASAFGFPLVNATLAGLGMVGLNVLGSVGSSISLKKRRDSPIPFEYLTSINRECGM